MYVADDAKLLKRLSLLPATKQKAFALLTCERMMPAFVRFATETGFDVSRYRSCLDECWKHLSGELISPEILSTAQECVANAPDTEDFSHPLTSAALNAALAVGQVVELAVDGRNVHIVEIANLARDTAGLDAQRVSDVAPRSLGYEEVMNHPIMLAEVQRQNEDLNFLESLPSELTPEMLQNRRRNS